MSPKNALYVALGLFSLYYLYVFFSGLQRARAEGLKSGATPLGIGVGAFTNFFDTLGIGSFAPTTTLFRRFRMVRDEKIPGTLNLGHTLPTIVQAFIFTTVVEVGTKTLISMIIAAVAGAWLGAGVFARWPRKKIQFGMGGALLVAAAVMAYRNGVGDPAGGAAIELEGTKLILGIAGNFVLGILMTIGIGLYGPCMLLIAMLGMSPTTAFPIMMGSCAFLMPVASGRFVREKSVDWSASVGLAIGGIPAVLVAAFIVKSLPLYWVKWLVVLVITYTAVTLLQAGMRQDDAELAADATEAKAGA